MSSRKPDLYLQDIVQACDDILNFTRGLHTAGGLWGAYLAQAF